MLVCEWVCTICGWEGGSDWLETDAEGHKVCPKCHRRGGLE